MPILMFICKGKPRVRILTVIFFQKRDLKLMSLHSIKVKIVNMKVRGFKRILKGCANSLAHI